MSEKEIYLVEDSPDFRQVVRSVFNKFLPGYYVRFFQGGNELYQYMILQSADTYTGRCPALIILDLKLPAIDGIDLLKLIRQTPSNSVTAWKYIPVVMLSGAGRKQDINHCYEAGANSFFVKPIEFEALCRMFELICSYWIDLNQLSS